MNEIQEGRISKGGQNPPNTSSARPPAPHGSDGQRTAIQMTIAAYVLGKTSPSRWDLQAFVGMIETGEATLEDFRAVGGGALVVHVQLAIRCGI